MRPRVVFDTSVVAPVLAIQGSQMAWLLAHWRDRNCIPLVSRETTRELLKVLNYRKFRLEAARLNELLADYLPYCETIQIAKPCAIQCRDKDDQPFLDLAHSAKADSLVTGDRDLLVLAGKTRFLIESPETYRRRVLEA